MTGKPYDIEHRLLVQGKTKWVREKAEFSYDEHGMLLSATGVVQDITDKKQIENSLISSEEKFRLAFMTSLIRLTSTGLRTVCIWILMKGSLI